ncbi:FAD-dependent monooxygenase [Paenibacillus sp. MABNR03]|uniref:FAD-dependent monooxygenase n=1 Tax=Paenibacillus sp. MABNR03 TaxID=3142626 RepID=UPI003D2E0142
MPQNKFEHAIIVGGSLGGLMMGFALSRSGYTVTILERADSSLRNGAFIRLQTKPYSNSKIERELRHLASNGNNNVEAWSAIQERLRNAVAKEPGITLLHHTRIVSVGQNESSAWATSEEEQTFKGDFLIGADGYRSIVRRYLSPDKPFADYAGYLVWVGKVDEELLPKKDWKKRQLSSAYFNDSAAGTLTTAVMPGIKGGINPGQRWIGFCWFDHSHNHLLSELGVLKGGIAQHSLYGEAIPDSLLEELSQTSQANWNKEDDAILQIAIKDRSLIGAPVNEYIPNILSKGRIAMIGDAAHTMSPMTGAGFNDSLDDTVAIMDSIKQYPNSITQALGEYQTRRLDVVRQDVLGGQGFNRSFGRF